MQVPIRKGDKVPRPKADPFMTEEKFRELQAKVQKWKTVNRPREAAEVARLALMGDFSENVGYQVAKGRLRGLNQRIIDTENLLARAEIIPLDEATDQIRLGHYVTIENLETAENKKVPSQQSFLEDSLAVCRDVVVDEFCRRAGMEILVGGFVVVARDPDFDRGAADDG